MTGIVPAILARIVAHKRERGARGQSVLDEWERKAERVRPGRRDFHKALSNQAPAIIAEIKQASPSKGILSRQFDPSRLAGQYTSGGAAALSVLTDEKFFNGSMEDLAAARAACALPVLRKDFTLDEQDVLEAAAGGADAILLIAAILDTEGLRTLAAAARRYGMAALVEVHDERELSSAMAADARIIGVNNRDLNTFEVNMETSLRLAPMIPAHVLKVSESGIHSNGDIRRLGDAGFQAFLIGERLMTSSDPAAALRELIAPQAAA